MALQLGALRDALLEAGATADTARKAAEEAASYENRLASVEGRLSLLTWMVGTNIALSMVLLGAVVTIFTRLGEVAGQLSQIAQRLH